MTVFDPVELIIVDVEEKTLKTPLFPKDESKGFRDIKFTNKLFVDRENIRLEDDPDFYGIAPNKVVGLKYAETIFIKEIKAENGIVVSVIAELDKEVNTILFRKENQFLTFTGLLRMKAVLVKQGFIAHYSLLKNLMILIILLTISTKNHWLSSKMHELIET